MKTKQEDIRYEGQRSRLNLPGLKNVSLAKAISMDVRGAALDRVCFQPREFLHESILPNGRIGFVYEKRFERFEHCVISLNLIDEYSIFATFEYLARTRNACFDVWGIQLFFLLFRFMTILNTGA